MAITKESGTGGPPRRPPRRRPNITQPLVRLTSGGVTRPPQTTQPSRQVDGRKKRERRGRIISEGDNAATVPERLTYPNGTYTRPDTSQIGATGMFGANLPSARFDTEGVPRSGITGSSGRRSTVPAVQGPGFRGFGGGNRLAQQRRNVPLSALTGANNAAGVNQLSYTNQNYGPPLPPGYRGGITAGGAQSQAEIIRRQQINQLTAPYQGSLAALTGANMIEPTNIGFPGTDPRQPYLRSNYPQSLIGDSEASGGGYYNYGRRRGGGGGGYGPQQQAYQESVMGQILDWRVATG